MGESVRDLDEVAEALQRYDGQRIWPVIIERRGRRYETALRLY
jgi:hypothetical protein